MALKITQLPSTIVNTSLVGQGKSLSKAFSGVTNLLGNTKLPTKSSIQSEVTQQTNTLTGKNGASEFYNQSSQSAATAFANGTSSFFDANGIQIEGLPPVRSSSTPMSSDPLASSYPTNTELPVTDAPTIESRRVILKPFDFEHPSPEMREYVTRRDNIMYPIYNSGGLVMTYTPMINETASMDYQSNDISQNNEGYNIYRGTKNRTITLSNIVFTCETPAQGLYALAAIHFLRSYSLTDFGVGRSGRPPSPMWFSAYGKYVYDKVPVLLSGYGFKTSDPELDLVPIVNPEQTSLYSQHRQSNISRNGSHKAELGLLRDAIQNIDYTEHSWLPVKVEIDSLTLTVQHTPLYWKTFNMDDYKSGRLAQNSEDWLW